MTLTFARRAGLATALALAASADHGQTIENQLVIVTSFSKDVTEPYRQAFLKKYPGTKVEVQNRNTAAAVLREPATPVTGATRGTQKSRAGSSPDTR